jgi:hypothetical protein
MPLGFDEIISVWPIGRAIYESPISNMPQLLISGFLNEDHLSPFFNFIAYLLYSSTADPIYTISTATKILYILILLLSVWLAHYFWNDRRKSLVVFLILIMNQSLMWNNSTYLLAFNIVILISLISFLILIKYLENYKDRYLFLLFFSLTIGTLTFENYFIMLPFLLVYAACLTLNVNIANFVRFVTFTKVCVILGISIIPYLLIHSYVFGTLLPSSRMSVTGDTQSLKNIAIVAAQIPNDWAFGVPSYVFKNFGTFYLICMTLGAVIFLCLYLYWARLRSIKMSHSPKNVYLFISLMLTIPVAWYTGRYHPGMWTFLGIIFVIVLADTIINILDATFSNEIIKYSLIALLIPLSVFSNASIRPHEQTKEFYRKQTNSSIAAYTAINSASDHLVVVKLRGADELMHPWAFWLGNKIYNNEPGLQFDKNSGAMRFHNIFVEYYENELNNTFEFYRSYVDNRTKTNSIVLFKNKNMFFKVLNDNTKKIMYRAAVIPETNQDSFEINLPTYVTNFANGNSLRFDLTLNSDDPIEIVVTYGGKRQEVSTVVGRKISFITNDMSLGNELVVKSVAGNNNLLKLIEVYFDSKVKFEDARSAARVISPALINVNAGACAVRIATRSGATSSTNESIKASIIGTIDGKSSLRLDTFLPFQDFQSHLDLEYWLLDLNRVNRLQHKSVLSDVLYKDNRIKVCL